MDGNGTVEVISQLSQYCNVSFAAETSIVNQNLKVLLNGAEVGNFHVPADTFSTITLNGMHFKKGLNELLFYSGQSLPANVLGNNSDIRRLSIAFQNVSILSQLR